MGHGSDRPQTTAAAVLAGLALLGPAGVATTRPPSLELQRATVDRAARTVDVRLRICFSSGPRASIAVVERRTLGGVVKASSRWSPRGAEPTRISPFTCKAGWRMTWLLKPRLTGPGTYRATIRVRDAHGRWTPPVGFSVTSA